MTEVNPSWREHLMHRMFRWVMKEYWEARWGKDGHVVMWVRPVNPTGKQP